MRETKIDLLAKICPLLFDKGTTAIQWKDNLQNMVLQQLDINRTKESSTLVLTSYTKIKQITDFKVKFETIKFLEKRQEKVFWIQGQATSSQTQTKGKIYERK